MDLWATKLVVLSACDTGVGEVRSGDGVYGLRRALVLAGSETQVMSLWPVSDKGTRDLIIGYYERLVAGVAEPRVEPDQAVAAVADRAQLAAQDRRVSALPAVAQDHHHRAAAEHAPRPAPVERHEALADARAAGPVDHLRARGFERSLGVACAQPVRDASEAGAEHERLGVREVP